MAQKTYKQIQEEANKRFGRGASDEKFEWRQSQQRAAGLAEEKRKRGGVARGWDVGKSWIRPAAELTAGFFGGPAAATTIGALLRGVDRPGKSGVGFDVKQGALGALEGYGVGGLGAGLKGAVQPAAGMGRTASAIEATKQYYKPGMQALATGAEATKEFVKENPTLTQMAVQGGLTAYQAAQAQALAEEEQAIQTQLQKEEMDRRRRLARLLAPALQGTARPFSPTK